MRSLAFPVLIATAIVLALSSCCTPAAARWLGPYDTHDAHSLWLRTQMERPRSSFLLKDGNNSAGALNILQYGAIPNEETLAAALRNGKAFYDTVLAANQSRAQKTVLVPAGANFWMIPHNCMMNIVGVTVQLDGNVSAWRGNETTAWPAGGACGDCKMDFISFRQSKEITLAGRGFVHGHGYHWWVKCFQKPFVDCRPNLIHLEVEKLVWSGWSLTNSPRYHLWSKLVGALIQDISIAVDVFDQYALHKAHGTSFFHGDKIDWPTFPLNTDGLDIHGNTVVVRNCFVENFDDAYCVKPSGVESALGCSHNILFEDSTVWLGVGMTIGSVGPSASNNCARNNTFRNMKSMFPLKSIYVKPNPGSVGIGTIADTLYENIHVQTALWWWLWVSTQQQDQPGGSSNTHCSFLYPLPGTKCPTQPRVPVTNLFLRNVTSVDSLLSPGVLRCNKSTSLGPGTGPCTGWEWENVRATSILNWPIKATGGRSNFLCHAIEAPKWTNVNVGCTLNAQDEEDNDNDNDNDGEHAKLLRALSKSRKDERTAEDVAVLDELARRIKRSGVSLWQAMLKLHPERK